MGKPSCLPTAQCKAPESGAVPLLSGLFQGWGLGTHLQGSLQGHLGGCTQVGQGEGRGREEASSGGGVTQLTSRRTGPSAPSSAHHRAEETRVGLGAPLPDCFLFPLTGGCWRRRRREKGRGRAEDMRCWQRSGCQEGSVWHPDGPGGASPRHPLLVVPSCRRRPLNHTGSPTAAPAAPPMPHRPVFPLHSSPSQNYEGGP